MTRIDEDPYKVTTRKRVIATDFVPWAAGVRYDGIFPSPIAYRYEGPRLYDAQITVSEGHPFWSQLKDVKGLKPDMGGAFSTTRWKCLVNKTVFTSSYVDNTSSHRLWQNAGNWVNNINPDYPGATYGWGYITDHTDPESLELRFPAMTSSDNELLAMGATAIARTLPTTSPASLTQFLVEVKRDGIPFRSKLSKEELKRLLKVFESRGKHQRSDKKAGDYFLENQFGLRPFTSDLTSFSRTALGTISTLDFLMKNSGKLVRRQFRFPHENVSGSIGFLPSPNPIFGFNTEGSQFVSDYGIRETVRRTSRKTWFSGAYNIYFPTDLEPVSRLKATADKMRWDYGLNVDFATLWNLAPWSWLLDWEVNLGDVIQNITAFQNDAVVLHYGYVMQQTKTTYTTGNTGRFRDVGTNGSALPDFELQVLKKTRARATPYGFGKTFGSLSNSQKAILAALGITRF